MTLSGSLLVFRKEGQRIIWKMSVGWGAVVKWGFIIILLGHPHANVFSSFSLGLVDISREHSSVFLFEGTTLASRVPRSRGRRRLRCHRFQDMSFYLILVISGRSPSLSTAPVSPRRETLCLIL